MAERVTVFVSYSHQDAEWLARLQVHLRPLAARLEVWDDTRLAIGDQWRRHITGAIDRARAAVLLVSADFLASDFVTREELPPLLAKAREDGALILPVIVKPCRFERHPELAVFQAANSPSKPLSGLPETESERVFVRVAERIEQVFATPTPISKPAPPQAVERPAFPHDTLPEALRTATMCLHVLTHLSRDDSSTPTLSELYGVLGATSRKGVVTTLQLLQHEGWVKKERTGKKTVWRITSEGLRQRARLASMTQVELRLQ